MLNIKCFFVSKCPFPNFFACLHLTNSVKVLFFIPCGDDIWRSEVHRSTHKQCYSLSVSAIAIDIDRVDATYQTMHILTSRCLRHLSPFMQNNWPTFPARISNSPPLSWHPPGLDSRVNSRVIQNVSRSPRVRAYNRFCHRKEDEDGLGLVCSLIGEKRCWEVGIVIVRLKCELCWIASPCEGEPTI